MRKLIDDMLRANPDERPTMDEVVERFGLKLMVSQCPEAFTTWILQQEGVKITQ